MPEVVVQLTRFIQGMGLQLPDQLAEAIGELAEQFWTDDQDGLSIDLTGVDRIEWCWPDGGFNGYNERIQRTLVIGDQLWTMSPAGLQANDLATLDRTAVVAF